MTSTQPPVRLPKLCPISSQRTRVGYSCWTFGLKRAIAAWARPRSRSSHSLALVAGRCTLNPCARIHRSRSRRCECCPNSCSITAVMRARIRRSAAKPTALTLRSRSLPSRDQAFSSRPDDGFILGCASSPRRLSWTLVAAQWQTLARLPSGAGRSWPDKADLGALISRLSGGVLPSAPASDALDAKRCPPSHICSKGSAPPYVTPPA